MGKTLKHKKRRKNTRRNTQKRRKTTRKSKRKHRRTKKQKGGLCCKYENDWNYENDKNGVNWPDKLQHQNDGCNKGFRWSSDIKADAPPFLLPIWQQDPVNNQDSEYYGNKFGMLKYTPVKIPNDVKSTIQGINIGLFYHSLKHMESLGIKCYDIKKFTTLIQRITDVGQWFYMRVKEEDGDEDEKELQRIIQNRAANTEVDDQGTKEERVIEGKKKSCRI